MQQRGTGLGRRDELVPKAHYEAQPDADSQALGGAGGHWQGQHVGLESRCYQKVSPICATLCTEWQVLFSEDGLAILEGLNNDAPVGASLRFVSGASGYVKNGQRLH